jgi:hypothetical protein
MLGHKQSKHRVDLVLLEEHQLRNQDLEAIQRKQRGRLEVRRDLVAREHPANARLGNPHRGLVGELPHALGWQLTKKHRN